MIKNMCVENRRYPRIGLKSPVRYQIRGNSQFDNALTNDISVGGINLTIGNFIAPLTTLMLEIKVLNRVIQPIGKVAWSKPCYHCNLYQMGVEFLEFSGKEVDYLKDFITLRQQTV